jgi:phosphoenolpyruvate-protein kinase (PTS system EI component)
MMDDPPGFTMHNPNAERLLEDYFYNQYSPVVRMLSQNQRYNREPVIVRMLDVTPDKQVDALRDEFGDLSGESGLRLLLNHPRILKTQMRAIARVARDSPGPEVVVMLSNVQRASDIQEFNNHLRPIQDEILRGRRLRCLAQIESTGVMQYPPLGTGKNELRKILELPFVDGCAFGTNDITVSALGKRGRDALRKYDKFERQVLSTLKMGMDTVHEYRKWPVICGGLGESVVGVALITGMCTNQNVRDVSISIPPRSMRLPRQIMPKLTVPECADLLNRVFIGDSEFPTGEDIYTFVLKEIKKK